MKRTWLLVASALFALFATSAFAYGAEVPTPPFDTNAKCLQCHAVTVSGGASLKVDFDVPGVVNYDKCIACHESLPDLEPFGGVSLATHYHFGTDCSGCHNGDDYDLIVMPAGAPRKVGYLTSTLFGYFVSAGSLAASPSQLHALHSGNGWVESQLSPANPQCSSCHATASCSACHDAPIAHGDHALPTYPGRTVKQANGTMAPAANSTCVDPACHSLAKAGTAAFTPTCGSCHPTNTQEHGFAASMHTADVTSTVDGGSKVCGDCHQMELYVEHQRATSSSKAAGCAVCHPSPRSSFTAWGQTCSQSGCHPAGSSTAVHGNLATAHAPLTTGDVAVCVTCHSQGDLGAIHANATSTTDPTKTSCLICHSSASVPSTKDCTTCHFTYANHSYPVARHQSTWTLANCGGAGCHASRDLMTAHTEKNAASTCADCHGSTKPSVVAAIAGGLTGCGDCHEGLTQTSGHEAQHWANPLLLDGTGPHYGYGDGSTSSTPTDDCTDCHTSNLIAEHLGVIDPSTGNIERKPRADSAGQALTCAACHNALPGSLVANAIVNGLTKCDACHVVHRQIPATHLSSYADSPQVPCSPCHSTQIEESHDGTYTVTTASGKVLTGCAVCHGYYEGARGAEVQSAITVTNDTKCTACHGASHPDLNSHKASSSASLACGTCHAAGSGATMDTKSIHQGASAGACAVCHDNSARVPDITIKTAECASCHTTENTDYHRGFSTASHASSQTDCGGSGCHSLADVGALHSTATTTVAGVTYSGCGVCHRSPTDQPTTTDCRACHAGHGDVTVLHTAPNSAACVDCHETANVSTLHAGASQGPCAVCHDNPAIPTLPASTDCSNCHGSLIPIDPNHYSATVHTSVDSTYSGVACSQCHNLGMKPEHVKASSGAVTCVQCHEAKVDGFTAAWNKACAACHTTTLHSQQPTKHVSTRTECAGSGCHAATDVATVHAGRAGGGCSLCHTGVGSLPATTDCASSGCHPTITGNHGSAHDTSVTVDAGCAGCHFTSLTTEHSKLGYTCPTCHASTNAAVTAAIASKSTACDGCHPAVNGRDRHAAQNSTEFVTGNSSGHRVNSSFSWMKTSFTVNSATYSWPAPTTSSFLKTGWTTTSVVQCKDCHNFGTSPAGPHGSTVAVNMDPAYPGDYTNAYLNGSNASPSNVICAKCHTNFGNMNEVHGEEDHEGSSDGKCVRCHTKVPHGWRLPRLLAYTSDPAQYSSTGLTGISRGNHTPSGWDEDDCSTSCDEHDSSMSNKWPSVVNTVGTLKGTVRSSAGAALPGVAVTTDKGQSATTNATGAYDFGSISTGTYQVTAALTGYASQTKPATLGTNQAVAVDFALVVAPVTASNWARTGAGSASSTY